MLTPDKNVPLVNSAFARYWLALLASTQQSHHQHVTTVLRTNFVAHLRPVDG